MSVSGNFEAEQLRVSVGVVVVVGRVLHAFRYARIVPAAVVVATTVDAALPCRSRSGSVVPFVTAVVALHRTARSTEPFFAGVSGGRGRTSTLAAGAAARRPFAR